MDLSHPQLEDSHSHRYDIRSENENLSNEEIRYLGKNFDKLFCRNAKNNFLHRKRNKVMCSSPLWRRDSTNRLQRKPIRKSISFESALNEIGGPEPLITDDHVSVFDSIPFNTPRLHRVEYSRLQQSRKDLMPVPNPSFLTSTMLKNHSGNGGIERNANPNILFRKSAELAKKNHIEKLKISESSQKNKSRNHTGQLKIANSWIDWTPFWIRENDSKRLDRRHYISDFV